MCSIQIAPRTLAYQLQLSVAHSTSTTRTDSADGSNPFQLLGLQPHGLINNGLLFLEIIVIVCFVGFEGVEVESVEGIVEGCSKMYIHCAYIKYIDEEYRPFSYLYIDFTQKY